MLTNISVCEQDEGWGVRAQFGENQKNIYIPFDDLETAVRYLAYDRYDKFVIRFLNGTILNVDQNTLEVR